MAIITDGDDTAPVERIAAVAGHTEARGGVVDDVTLGIGAAQSRTRVLALLTDARLGGGAVRVEHALGFASLDGVAEVVGHALAHGRSALLPADGVRAARRWHARIEDRSLGHRLGYNGCR